MTGDPAEDPRPSAALEPSSPPRPRATCRRSYLGSTAPRAPVEASPVDPTQGIGLSSNETAAAAASGWRGRNLLGFALTEVRKALAG